MGTGDFLFEPDRALGGFEYTDGKGRRKRIRVVEDRDFTAPHVQHKIIETEIKEKPKLDMTSTHVPWL